MPRSIPPLTGPEQARRELDQQRSALALTLADLLGHLKQLEASRAWRFGHGMARLVAGIRGKPPVTRGALDAAIRDVRRLQEVMGLPPDLQSPTTPVRVSAPATPDVDVDAMAASLRDRLGPMPELDDWPLVTVVALIRHGNEEMCSLVRSLAERTDYERMEVVVADLGRAGDEVAPPVGASLPFPVRVVRTTDMAAGPARNRGVEAAAGDLYLFCDGRVEAFERGWLRELVVAARTTGAAAVAATLVSPGNGDSNTAVQRGGYWFRLVHGVPRVVAEISPADDAAKSPAIAARGSAPAACLLVDREAFDRVGGFASGYRAGGEGVDFGLRCTATGRDVLVCTRAQVIDHSGVDAERAIGLADEPVFLGRWGPALRREVRLAERNGDPRWKGGRAPSSTGDTGGEPASFCVKVATPSRATAPGAGDLQFGEAIARELRRRGHAVVVQTADEHEELAGLCCDVVVHLRGLRRWVPRPGQVNVLWCISHPDEVTPSECQGYDLVAVASEPLASAWQSHLDRPVLFLEQATDPQLFFPEPDPAMEHQLVFVGNSRGVERPILRDLLPTDRDLAVWGSGWDRRIDPRYLLGGHLAPDRLRGAYSSAGIVLNDHWGDMRANCVVSNRIFDALACGAVVVSDHLPGLAERFDGGVVTYRSRRDLEEAIDSLLASPDDRAARGARGRAVVLAHDSFRHRIDALLEALGDVTDLAGGTRILVADRSRR